MIDDEFNGFLVPADDHLGYADRIQLLHTNEVAAQSVASNALKRVHSEFTWQMLEMVFFACTTRLSQLREIPAVGLVAEL